MALGIFRIAESMTMGSAPPTDEIEVEAVSDDEAWLWD